MLSWKPRARAGYRRAVLFEGSCHMAEDQPTAARDARDLSVVSLKR
jgi:hypothetical protein